MESMLRLSGVTNRVASVLAFFYAWSFATAIYPDVAEPDFKFCGRIGDLSGSTFLNNGSGVAIAPYWVLSAAHVTGAWFETEGVRYEIATRHFHTSASGNADITLCRLVNPVPYVTPVLYRPYSGTGGLQGRVCKLVGNGATANMTNAGYALIGNSSGPRRSAYNSIDDYWPGLSVNIGGGVIKKSDYIVWDSDHPFYDVADPRMNPIGAGPVNGEGSIIVKDSGSGVFVYEAGVWQLVAISGLVGRYDSGSDPYAWGGVGLAVILNNYQSWISSTMGP